MSTKIKYGLKELQKELVVLTFGKLLETHRKCEELTQKEFAKLLGISASSLCDIEKGRKIPSPGRVLKFAKKLGYSEELWIQISLQDQLRKYGIDLEVSVA